MVRFLSAFMGIEQAHSEPSSPPYPASTNHRYSGLQWHCPILHHGVILTLMTNATEVLSR